MLDPLYLKCSIVRASATIIPNIASENLANLRAWSDPLKVLVRHTQLTVATHAVSLWLGRYFAPCRLEIQELRPDILTMLINGMAHHRW